MKNREVEKIFSERKYKMYKSMLLFLEAKSSDSGKQGQVDRI